MDMRCITIPGWRHKSLPKNYPETSQTVFLSHIKSVHDHVHSEWNANAKEQQYEIAGTMIGVGDGPENAIVTPLSRVEVLRLIDKACGL